MFKIYQDLPDFLGFSVSVHYNARHTTFAKIVAPALAPDSLNKAGCFRAKTVVFERRNLRMKPAHHRFRLRK